jgi:hypothetical protein
MVLVHKNIILWFETKYKGEKPSWAHGIEAEIPEDLRSKAEELERIARFFAARKGSPFRAGMRHFC